MKQNKFEKHSCEFKNEDACKEELDEEDSDFDDEESEFFEEEDVS